MNSEKFIKTSNVIDRILKILQGFLAACVIVSAVFIPLIAIFGEKMVVDEPHLTVGEVTLRLSGDMRQYLNLSGFRTSMIIALLSGIVALAVTWLCLRKVREILSPMKEGRPFEKGTGNRIRELALLVLIGGGIAEVGSAVGRVFGIRAYNIPALINHPSIEGISFNITIRLWFVVVAVVLFFLSFVFRYGEELQRESDETL
ncbi:MAG: DUF2975 domain-containing protein [Oscillospiraceae bacterium]|nr:DUF2975 domain-containing protein [Oscillospiraceae bacterium]MBR0392844.1 DUF2975 domain-containing protein [Oscillospiraceae bacterium]